ncbi:NIL domain-containing protein [Oscillatoria acuminata]|uniref:NIL domain-containing protein n=1 Tax=Oscillatoria acuminata PCC 6304 TaxID=56110 RepID=K9TH32_9CYAN|nr:NIL domain-containing protein [Oscillatoria acuminata]AFY81451.1 NIL domain-containing protein [Oscillatoria acuminata PCC 6304]
MATHSNYQAQVDESYPGSQSPSLQRTTDDSRPTHLRIRIRIPKEYQEEPIISRLISDHELTVNLNAALLASNIKNDGWFDLDLRGKKCQIDSAMIYLNDLDVEIWSKSTDPDEENW